VKHKLDGAGTRTHANRPSIEALSLATLPPAIADAAVSEDIMWTKADRKGSVESRHDRISTLAYYLSEARGFEPGHHEEDWLIAQSEIDAVDGTRD
jgi:hypothetical protein